MRLVESCPSLEESRCMAYQGSVRLPDDGDVIPSLIALTAEEVACSIEEELCGASTKSTNAATVNARWLHVVASSSTV